MNDFDFRKKFITFDGIEGCGKSTNLKFIATKLKAKGVDVVVTREPGGTAIGEDIRKILLANYQENITAISELLLLFAARSQHITKVIRPALAAGSCVISDRFTEASYAYQGGGRAIDSQIIAFLEQVVQQELRPDLTIIFDIPVELSIKRIKQRTKTDRIEQEQIDFFSKARQVYLARAKSMPERAIIIDATKPLKLVQQELQNLFGL